MSAKVNSFSIGVFHWEPLLNLGADKWRRMLQCPDQEPCLGSEKPAGHLQASQS